MRLTFALIIIHVLCFDLSQKQAAAMTKLRRRVLREKAKEMFLHGYNSYVRYAFPLDELRPLSCSGRGPVRPQNRQNAGINDVLGGYATTLIDSMDTLAIMGLQNEFEDAIRKTIETVDFRKLNSTVQVFESTIRILGGLLSAHVFATESLLQSTVSWYDGKLLAMAQDLGERLLTAFDDAPLGIPKPRVHLGFGMPALMIDETCTAGAGSLLLEFGTLSRLTNDSRYEQAATKALHALWKLRSPLNLMGNALDYKTGRWLSTDSGIGAGVDSFFEYLFKSYVLFGDKQYLEMFETAYEAIKTHLMDHSGLFCRNVNMHNGQLVSTWIDSLSAFFPGLQVLAGDVGSASILHEVYYSLWRKFQSLPERWNYHYHRVDIANYPLRPELIESTYLLYQATKHPYYLEAGEKMMMDIEQYMRQKCGYASLSNVVTKTKDDRMESFFLSETLKYLYLLFDEENILHSFDSNYVFTTEAHIMIIPPRLSFDFLSMKSADAPIVESAICLDVYDNWSYFRRPLQEPTYLKIQYLLGNIDDRAFYVSTLEQCLASSSSTKLQTVSVDYTTLNQLLVAPPLPSPEALFDGTILLDSLHRVNLVLGELENSRYLIRKVGELELPSQKELLVLQNGIKIINDGQNMFDEYHPWMLTVYDGEEWLKVTGAPAIFSPTSTNMLHGLLVFMVENQRGCRHFLPHESKWIKGNIILVRRGECSFKSKTFYAENAGARLLLVVNTEESLMVMGDDDKMKTYSPEISSIMLRGNDGYKIVEILKRSDHVEIAAIQMTRFHFESHKEQHSYVRFNDRFIDNLRVISQAEYDYRRSKGSISKNEVYNVLQRGMRPTCLTTCLSRNICCR